MIHHPLVRCGLFIVAYFLSVFLLASFPGSFYWTVAMNQLAVVIATGVMLALDHRGPAFIGLTLKPGWWQQFLAGLWGGTAMIAIIATFLRITGSITWQTQVAGVGGGAAAGDRAALRALALAAMFLFAAAGEELLFRGYGFQRLIESVGPTITLVVLSLFFAAGHFHNPHASWPGLANTVLVGLLFGFAYLRTGRLWLPIGWHWGWNLAEAMFGFPVSGLKFAGVPFIASTTGSPLLTGGAYGPEAGIPATIVLLAGLLLVLRWGYGRETQP